MSNNHCGTRWETSRHSARTPIIITKPIRELSSELGSMCKPFHLTITPAPWARELLCYGNCAYAQKLWKATPAFGWTISEYRGVFLLAEHHCVLLRNDGRYVDITPMTDCRRCLFAPTGETVGDGDWSAADRRIAELCESGNGAQFRLLVDNELVKESLEVRKQAAILQQREMSKTLQTGRPISGTAVRRYCETWDRADWLLDKYFELLGRPSKRALRKQKKAVRQRRKGGRRR